MIGGLMDGKWHTHEGGGHMVRVLKPMRIMPLVSREITDLATPLPEYEEYLLEHVALYGQGIWVGMHRSTLDRMDMEIFGSPEAHTVMILRAILQRDVATELGL